MLLAGDIGGTKTRLAVFSPEQGPNDPVAQKTFASKDYPNLETIAEEFLSAVEVSVDQGAFGVAGPVVEGEATITNLPWVIRESRLCEVLGQSSATLLNDLQSIAYAVPFLGTEDLHTLNDAEAEPGGNIAVIAPGTGLGEAYLSMDGGRYRAHPSEGGHADFGPTNALEMGLLRYMMERYDHVSYEKVCSGRGIPNLYAYLKDSGYAPEPPWLSDRLAAAADPTPVIVSAALEHEKQPCELAVATLRLFVSILGAEAGNLALKLMSTAGVYLGGGIPPRIIPWLEHKYFMQAFLNKGRFSSVLIRFPVHVILRREVALFGVACYGLGL